LRDQFGYKFDLPDNTINVPIVNFPVVFRGNVTDEKVIAFELTEIVPPFRLSDQAG
jgi:hypothetical protein